MHLPPAQAELYDGPHAEWLRDVLDALPNLQSLIVSRLPFFDHQALLALRSYKSCCQAPTDEEHFSFPLRLLIAAQCKNMTAFSLAKALKHFVSLAYLDLSGNSSARDFSVLSTFHNMSNLHILRLQHCQLRDADIDILATSIGRRVRSLDLRHNILTDAGVRTLLQHCFNKRGGRSRAFSGVMVEDSADWPAGIARPSPRILDEFRDEALNDHFVKRLTTGIVNSLPSQNLCQSGVTHFYVAGNNLSIEIVSSLIMNASLYALDIGSLQTSKVLSEPRAMSSSSLPTSEGSRITIPGAERLVSILDEFGRDLRYLRLHHSVATQKAAPMEEHDSPMDVELEGSLSRYEVDSTPIVPELPTDEPAPRYELPGAMTQITLSPIYSEKPSLGAAEEPATARRGSSSAPEAVDSLIEDDDASLILTTTRLGSMAQAMNSTGSSDISKPVKPELNDRLTNSPSATLHPTEIKKRIQDLHSQQRSKPHGLLPSMLPQLRTLVLTGVPCLENNGIINFLVSFIEACAIEAEIARLRQLLALEILQKRNCSNSIMASNLLARIVLEMGPPNLTSAAHGLNSPLMPQTSSSAFRTKSSTEDPDSEALWSAQENDFSFFDNDEECGLPSKETRHSPLPALSGKMVMPPNGSQFDLLPTLQSTRGVGVGVDVVRELSKFRRERKAAYAGAVNSGQHYVEGYWPGEIKVVRWNAKASHQADYHGNVYDRGVY